MFTLIVFFFLCVFAFTGLKLRVRNEKNNFLISQPKHNYVVGTQKNRSFEHPECMLKLMVKKILTILRSKTLLI